ncbi:MAG TPA: hypothetical protein VIL74_09460 [Pyrinomonadaceae bacterium]|jgi:hypothetical protein
MTKKKDGEERETKAGMLKDNDSEAASERENKIANESEGTPKISKEKAQHRDHEKPIH